MMDLVPEINLMIDCKLHYDDDKFLFIIFWLVCQLVTGSFKAGLDGDENIYYYLLLLLFYYS